MYRNICTYIMYVFKIREFIHFLLKNKINITMKEFSCSWVQCWRREWLKKCNTWWCMDWKASSQDTPSNFLFWGKAYWNYFYFCTASLHTLHIKIFSLETLRDWVPNPYLKFNLFHSQKPTEDEIFFVCLFNTFC